MDKNLSIVLSNEVKNYRKLAQQHYNLSDEQMRGKHVHHNPPIHKGGRNISEHLYVYDSHLHDLVHGGNGYCLSCSAGGKIGGKIGGKSLNKNKETCRKGGKKGGKVTGAKAQSEGIGFFGLSPEVRKENSRKGGQRNSETGQILTIATEESRARGGLTSSKLRYRCTITGKVLAPGPLSVYQKARGINPLNREKFTA